MDRTLIDYLPPVLRDIQEFREINKAVEPELSLAWDAYALLLANIFLDSATELGVSIWEQELHLLPKDTDLLDVRKARIKAKWNLDAPYSIPWLKKWLSGLCGPMGYEVSICDYTIDVQLDYDTLPNTDNLAKEILDMLLTVRPANMEIMLTAFLQSYGNATVSAGASEYNNTIEIYPLGG